MGQWILRLLRRDSRCYCDSTVENVKVETGGILTETFCLQMDHVGINPIQRQRNVLRKRHDDRRFARDHGGEMRSLVNCLNLFGRLRHFPDSEAASSFYLDSEIKYWSTIQLNG